MTLGILFAIHNGPRHSRPSGIETLTEAGPAPAAVR